MSLLTDWLVVNLEDLAYERACARAWIAALGQVLLRWRWLIDVYSRVRTQK
jgi:hypothetical protein